MPNETGTGGAPGATVVQTGPTSSPPHRLSGCAVFARRPRDYNITASENGFVDLTELRR